MKSILLIFLFFPILTYSQINVLDKPDREIVGEVKQVGVPVFTCTKENEIYTIKYFNNLNREVLDYSEFWLKNEDDAFNQLYQLIINAFEKRKANEIELQVGSGKIRLEFMKSIAGVFLRFAQYDQQGEKIIAYSITINKRQVKRLFGN